VLPLNISHPLKSPLLEDVGGVGGIPSASIKRQGQSREVPLEQKQDIGNTIRKSVSAGLSVPEYHFSELLFKFMKADSDIATLYCNTTVSGAVWAIEYEGKTYAINISPIPIQEEA